jgi:glycosyltransferase involved in cell wall biosynthesis
MAAVVERLWQFGRSHSGENPPVDGRSAQNPGVIFEGMQARTPRVLVLVENLSVPRDKRVWPECLTLRDAGFDVVVVCPQGEPNDTARFERVDGIEIHRYPARFAEGGAPGYLREYGTSLWRMSWLAWRAAGRRGFDVVHAANPPDLLLLAALPMKMRGARLIFDQHDLVPELYECRFGGGGLLYRIARAAERLTYRLADVVITPNESYRRIAMQRGAKRPEDVFVVRNAPDVSRMRPQEGEPALRRGRAHLLAYAGVMGPQDGLDLAVSALGHLRTLRDDWHAVFVGDGDELERVRALAERVGVAERVEFTGFLHDPERVRHIVASADVCIAPEPKNPLNDASTMIKIAEYMAMARPVVAFDLTESRVTAGDAAVYAEPNDPSSFARCIDGLLDDPGRRAEMGATGRRRVENGLGWEHSQRHLLDAYTRALEGAGV